MSNSTIAKLQNIKPLNLTEEQVKITSTDDIGLLGKFQEIASAMGTSGQIVGLEEAMDSSEESFMFLVIKVQVDSTTVDVNVVRTSSRKVIGDVASSVQALHVAKTQGVPSLKTSNGLFVAINEQVIELFLNGLDGDINIRTMTVETESSAVKLVSGDETITLTAMNPDDAKMFSGTLNNLLYLIPLNEATVECLEKGTEATLFTMAQEKLAVFIFNMGENGFVQLNDNAYVLTDEDGTAHFLANIRHPNEQEPLGIVEIQRSIYSPQTILDLMEKINAK